MAVQKICEVCQQGFKGRVDAKTCSARCRKRLHISKQSFSNEIDKLAQPVSAITSEIKRVLAPYSVADENTLENTTANGGDYEQPELSGIGKSNIIKPEMPVFVPPAHPLFQQSMDEDVSLPKSKRKLIFSSKMRIFATMLAVIVATTGLVTLNGYNGAKAPTSYTSQQVATKNS